MNTLPLNFGSDGAGDGSFQRTASGECIPDSGAQQFQGNDKNCLSKFLNGRLTGENTVLCSAEKLLVKGVNFSIRDLTKIGKALRTHVERLVSCFGRQQLIPVCIVDNIFNFYMSKELKSTETNSVNNSQPSGKNMAEQRARKSSENTEQGSGPNW